jgi:hypothetical protein
MDFKVGIATMEGGASVISAEGELDLSRVKEMH